MIIGIPNVGKSSLINRLANKNTQTVGNKPGVTLRNQWIRIGNNVELLDTPGVLWPKLGNEQTALNLAFTGTIKDEILDNLEIAYNLLKFLLNNYRENLIATYKITNEEIDNLLGNENQAENENIMDVMRLIGRKRGAIISGGNIDENKTANIIIKDFREAKLGRITLEMPQ
jgi:ribosome biogenesis GTPase A